MLNKRYFELKQYQRKWIAIDFETHLFIRDFAQRRGLTMAEAVYVLTGPGLAAFYGLDYQQVLKNFDLLPEQDTAHSR